MATIEILNDLLAQERRSIEAHEAAIARLERHSDKEALELALLDHRKHVAAIEGAVPTIESEPRLTAPVERFVTKGRVVLGALVGDRAILSAIRDIEDDSNRACERAGRSVTEEPIQDMIREHLDDERRHRAWLSVRISAAVENEPEGEPRHRWIGIFDTFTKEHRGWLGALEMIGPGIGDQIAEEEWQPFEGISADLQSAGGDRVNILLGSEPGALRDHVITNPRHIRLHAEAGAESMQFELDDGSFVLLRIKPAPALPMPATA